MAATYALALAEPRTRNLPAYGTRAKLAAGNGDVEGHLALAGCDQRSGTASYALRIINQSCHALRARMTCKRFRGESVLAYPLDVHVAPFSIAETLLPVRMADVGPYERAIVEVCGGDVAFSLEAPAPPKIAKRSRWVLAAASSVVLTLACAFGAAASTPRLALLGAPNRAFGGTVLDVPYAFSGWASMQYALQTRDGRQLSAGFASTHEGTLHFSVPSAAGSNVVLSVNVAGPFGRLVRKQSIAIGAPAPRRRAPQVAAPASPHIGELAVATPLVRAGSDVKITYTTDARSGDIWLIDEAGRLWARAPITPYGETTLKVPQAAAGRALRAVLHASNQNRDAMASVAFMVMPGAVVPDAQSADAPKTAASAQLALSTQQAAPGDVVTVMLDGPHGDARISMTDGTGAPVEQADIPSDQSAVTITAPDVTKTTTYYVMASISHGVADETVVRKLTVSPRDVTDK